MAARHHHGRFPDRPALISTSLAPAARPSNLSLTVFLHALSRTPVPARFARRRQRQLGPFANLNPIDQSATDDAVNPAASDVLGLLPRGLGHIAKLRAVVGTSNVSHTNVYAKEIPGISEDDVPVLQPIRAARTAARAQSLFNPASELKLAKIEHQGPDGDGSDKPTCIDQRTRCRAVLQASQSGDHAAYSNRSGLFVSDDEVNTAQASQLDELDWQILHLGQSRGSPTHPVPQHDHHSRSLKRSREEDEEKSLYSYGMLQNPNMVEREPRQSFPKTLKRPTRKISRHQQRDTAPRTLENPKSKESQKNRRIPRRLPIGQLPLVMDKITNEVEVHDDEIEEIENDLEDTNILIPNVLSNPLEAKPPHNGTSPRSQKPLSKVSSNILQRRMKPCQDLSGFRIPMRLKIPRKFMYSGRSSMSCSDGFEGSEALPTGRVAQLRRKKRRRVVNRQSLSRMGELPLTQSHIFGEQDSDIWTGTEPAEHADLHQNIIPKGLDSVNADIIQTNRRLQPNSEVRIYRPKDDSLYPDMPQISKTPKTSRIGELTKAPASPVITKSTFKRRVTWDSNVAAWTQLMTVKAPIANHIFGEGDSAMDATSCDESDGDTTDHGDFGFYNNNSDIEEGDDDCDENDQQKSDEKSEDDGEDTEEEEDDDDEDDYDDGERIENKKESEKKLVEEGSDTKNYQGQRSSSPPTPKSQHVRNLEHEYEILKIENTRNRLSLAEPNELLFSEDVDIVDEESSTKNNSTDFREPLHPMEMDEDDSQDAQPPWRSRIPIPSGLVNEEEHDDIADSPIYLRRTASLGDEEVGSVTQALAALQALQALQKNSQTDTLAKSAIPKPFQREASWC